MSVVPLGYLSRLSLCPPKLERNKGCADNTWSNVPLTEPFCEPITQLEHAVQDAQTHCLFDLGARVEPNAGLQAYL